MKRPALITFALLSGCFALGVTVEPELVSLKPYARHDQSPVEVVLGDGRRLFATHFFTKADIYFHSGYYPSIFDQASAGRESHIASSAGAIESKEHGEEDFLGRPLDCIDSFSRSFFPSTHTHLDEAAHAHHHDHESSGETQAEPAAEDGKMREMLPWLRMTAQLDPNRVETYTVGSYWLRTRMNKPQEAEAFLREGLRANPGNYAILFELGRIYEESEHDSERARNLWESALKHWQQIESAKTEPETFLLLQITWHLALLEEKAGNFEKAVSYLEIAKAASPNAAGVQQRIEEIKRSARLR